jgi:integrase
MLLAIRGKSGWRHVEVGRGSRLQTCPVEPLEKWRASARILHGPVFRRLRGRNRDVGSERLHDEQVARIVRSAAFKAGVKGEWPEERRRAAFAGRSLRSGFASSASVDEAQVKRQMGHASAEMTRSYR